MPEPGWVRDPSGRYHQRYFDGVRWTEHVADEYGRRAIDPVEVAQQAQAAAPATPAQLGQGTPAQGVPAQGTAAQGAPAQLPATTGGQRLFESQLDQRSAASDATPAPAILLTAVGTAVAVAALCFLPWVQGTRAPVMFSLPDGSWKETIQFSYFESGWVVTLICALFAVAVVTVGGAKQQAWTAAVPIGVSTAWALICTIWVKIDYPIDFSYGFFVGAAGLVCATAGPVLAAVATPSRRT